MSRPTTPAQLLAQLEAAERLLDDRLDAMEEDPE